MRTKLTFLTAAIAAIAAGNFNYTNAQNVSPYWSLAGNSNGSNTTSKLGTTNSVNLRLYTKNLERMRIDTAGRVGIGTTTPGSLLEVKSTGIGQVARFNGTSQTFISIYENSVARGYFGSYAGSSEDVDLGTTSGNSIGKVHLAIKGVPKLTVNTSGFVGVGTTAPLYPLDVNGRIRLRGVDASNTAGLWLNNIANTNVTGFIGVAQDKRIGFYGAVSGWSLIMNTDNGNVGIGTYNPAYKFSVNGTIQAKEVRVETGWADYVFEKEYQLRPLAEVDAFIKQHKHLPGMASAKEIQANGLAVGATQTKMMEKIEELTLYVIDLQNQIAQLKSEKR